MISMPKPWGCDEGNYHGVSVKKHCKFAYDANSKAERGSVYLSIDHGFYTSQGRMFVHQQWLVVDSWSPEIKKPVISQVYNHANPLLWSHCRNAALLVLDDQWISGLIWSSGIMMLGKNPDFFIGPTLLLHAFILHGSFASFTMFSSFMLFVFLQCFIWFLIILIAVLMQYVLGICFPDVVRITRQQVFLLWHPLLKTAFPVPAYTTVTSLLDRRSLWHSLKLHGSPEIKGKTLPLVQSWYFAYRFMHTYIFFCLVSFAWV